MTQDFLKGWQIGKILKRSDYPSPVQFVDFHGDQTEFIRGMRFAGYGKKVEFKCEPTY